MTKSLKNIDDLSVYLAAKDEYIIKPPDNYASTGVCAGKEYKQEEWELLLKEKTRENYIIQEYCPPALSENVLYKPDGNVELHYFNNLTGLYVYNRKFSGIFSRAGLNAIISGQPDSYTMSSVYVE
jgi:hypothetical protein